jgi:hypothetical protein
MVDALQRASELSELREAFIQDALAVRHQRAPGFG